MTRDYHSIPRRSHSMFSPFVVARGLGVVIGCALGLFGAPAAAEFGTGVDVMENIFGATNINATVGHGRLTAGFSRDGDLTILSWPGPSYADQLAYLSSNAIDARAEARFGAEEGMGSFLGLVVTTEAGTEVTWLRERAQWSISQSYGTSDGPNAETRFVSTGLGLTVVVVDAIDPERDVLVREVVVSRDADSGVTAAALLTYANFSPMPVGSRIEKLPIADWVLDGRNDYAAAWDSSVNAIIHFHPQDQLVVEESVDLIAKPSVDFGGIGDLLESAIIDGDLVATFPGLLDEYQDGAYLGLTTIPAPDQYQIGFDETPICAAIDRLADNIVALPQRFPNFEIPLPEGAVDLLRCPDGEAPDYHTENSWLYAAEDALADAADGVLSGSPMAAGEVNEALRTPLSFVNDVANASVIIAAGPSAADVRALLSGTSSPEVVVSESESAVATWLQGQRLPTALGELVTQVARRALLNVRVGTDAATGAIVASIARQPPYHLDWPRDGAFFNVMLDVAGQRELVSERSALYASWQRQQPVTRDPLIDPPPPPDPDGAPPSQYPAFAWDMNFLADGTVGGIFRFEIDTTAFAVWTIVAHVGWLEEQEREPYLREHWETIRSAADLLARWRDAETGLQAPAQEDDSGVHAQTIHGASTVFGALDIAARAGRYLGEGSDASRWERRAGELRRAIIDNLYDAEEERFIMGETGRGPFAASGLTPSGPTGWLVWPMTLFDYDDPRIQKQVAYDLGIVTPMIDLETVGGLYFMKNTNAAAVALLGLEGDELTGQRAELERLTRALAGHATPDTQQFGEVMVVVESDEGGAIPEQRTSTPHLWESTLFYLTAIAAEEPRALLAYDDVLPPSRVGQNSGCGCQGASPVRGAALAFAIASLLALLLVRRRA